MSATWGESIFITGMVYLLIKSLSMNILLYNKYVEKATGFMIKSSGLLYYKI
jgi:hypothetical protein